MANPSQAPAVGFTSSYITLHDVKKTLQIFITGCIVISVPVSEGYNHRPSL